MDRIRLQVSQLQPMGKRQNQSTGLVWDGLELPEIYLLDIFPQAQLVLSTPAKECFRWPVTTWKTLPVVLMLTALRRMAATLKDCMAFWGSMYLIFEKEALDFLKPVISPSWNSKVCESDFKRLCGSLNVSACRIFERICLNLLKSILLPRLLYTVVSRTL